MTERLRCPWAGTDPVSYTHLDVYKRQLLGRSLPGRRRWPRMVRLGGGLSSDAK